MCRYLYFKQELIVDIFETIGTRVIIKKMLQVNIYYNYISNDCLLYIHFTIIDSSYLSY